MAKRDIKKSKPRIGRPPSTGSGQPFLVRMHARQIKALDGWIAMQGEAISRPEAIRRLVATSLEAARKGGKGR